MNDRSKLLLGILIILGAIGLGIWQWNVGEALKIETNSLNSTFASLSQTKEELEGNFQTLKTEVNESRKSSEQKLSAVFPLNEDITELTRIFDDFEAKNNFATNPFFISSVNYQNETASEDGAYRYVSLTVSVETSRKNLDKFIEFIENSGSLEAEARLMSIERMRLSYPDEFGGTYDVDFEIYAYFSRTI